MTDTNRPYLEGIAWDEAWRQRQRADKHERIAAFFWGALIGIECQVEPDLANRIKGIRQQSIKQYGCKQEGGE